MTKNNDATRALEIFTNAVDMDGWVYDEGKCNRSEGFSIMTPQQHKIICTALLKSAQVDGLVKAVADLIDLEKHAEFFDVDNVPLGNYKVFVDLKVALQQFSATEI